MTYNLKNHETWVIEQAKQAERERIIKLLEDFLADHKDFDGMAFYRMGVLDALATIKGKTE